MSAVKRFAENVSVEMGFGGEITDVVMEEAERRMIALDKGSDEPMICGDCGGQEEDEMACCSSCSAMNWIQRQDLGNQSLHDHVWESIKSLSAKATKCGV